MVTRLSASASSLEFSPASPGELAVTAGSRVALVDAATAVEKRAITKFKEGALSGTYRSDGRLLAAGGVRPVVQVFDLGSRGVLRALEGHNAPVHVVRFAADTAALFSASDDCSVRHWDMATAVCTTVLERAHGDYIRCGAASAASPAVFVTGSYDHSVRLWDFRAAGGGGGGSALAAAAPRAAATEARADDSDEEEGGGGGEEEEEDEEEVEAPAAGGAGGGSSDEEDEDDADEDKDDSADADAAADDDIGGGGATAASLAAAPRRAAPTPLPPACALSVDHGSPVTSVVLRPGGGTLLTSGGNYVRLWDLVGGGRLLHEFSSHVKLITAMALDGTGTRLLTGGLDSLVKVHELSTYAVTHTLRADAPILSLAVSPDNARLALGCTDGTLALRHRAAKVEEMVREAKSTRLLRGGTYRYFMRGQAAGAAGADVVAPVGAGGAKRRRLAGHDRHLRAFEYGAALDAAIASNDAVVATSVLEELAARGGLRAALERRDEDRLAPVLAFLVRHVSNPRHARLLLDVADRECSLQSGKGQQRRRCGARLLCRCPASSSITSRLTAPLLPRAQSS